MKIEKITENKIRIILSLSDLEEEHIDLHSFMSNSAESQALFCNLLNKAEKEVGFNTKDYKLMIEAIAVPEGNFILTITRLPEKEKSKKLRACFLMEKAMLMKRHSRICKFNLAF